MTEQGGRDDGFDLEYDLAHEGALARSEARRSAPQVVVVTETSDQGEDYSYDLAHDIPPQR